MTRARHTRRRLRPRLREKELWIHARSWPGPARAGRLPVVLVHGFGISGRYLEPIGERLARERPVHAPDLPGHGRSDDPHRVLDIPELADALAAWMEAAGIARAALLGNSMGCQVVADLALRYPDRVDRLVLVGPTADPRARSLPRILPRFLRTALAERLSLVLLVSWDFLRAGPVRLWRELGHLFADRLEDKLPRVAAPVLVVRGGRDALVSPEWAARLAAAAPRGSLRVLPRGSHAVHYGAPDRLMPPLREFLDGDTGAPAVREPARHSDPAHDPLPLQEGCS